MIRPETCVRVAAAFLLAIVPRLPALAETRTAFVTSTAGTGKFSTWAETDLNGLLGADAICQARANAEVLGGTYRAWISTDQTDAYCHLFNQIGSKPTCASSPNPDTMGPWVRVDGTPFAANLAKLAGPEHAVYQPALFDETGAEVPDADMNYWTSTDELGVNNGTTCGDWTVETGIAGTGLALYVGKATSYYISLNCDVDHRLLCLEVGTGDAQKLPSETGSIVFVTSVTGPGRLQSWADSGGQSSLDAGDEICRARARAAKLPSPDSFVALLSTTAVDANVRMTSAGPFVRVDGFLFSPSRAALFNASPDVRTGLNVTEFGTYVLSDGASDVWTNTNAFGESQGTTNCDDWTLDSSTPGDYGIAGSSESTRFNWSWVSSPLCSKQGRLFCFSNVVTLFWDNFERANTSRWTNGTP